MISQSFGSSSFHTLNDTIVAAGPATTACSFQTFYGMGNFRLQQITHSFAILPS